MLLILRKATGAFSKRSFGAEIAHNAKEASTTSAKELVSDRNGGGLIGISSVFGLPIDE